MTVAMVHNASLDEMEALAKNAFSNIRNKNIPERIWPARPFKRSQV
jgi:predicted Zn-dependent peptidase